MKITPVIIIITLVLSACSKKEESIFFEDCSCNKIDFANGINITDSLNHYSVKYPSMIWQPIRNLDEFHNGITGFNTENEELEALAITETIKGDNYVSAEEEMKKYPFKQIVDQGKIKYLGKQRDWRIIKHDDEPTPYYSLYLTVDSEKVVHTINFTVEQGKNYKDKICRLEKYLDQIEIY
jgi:hypothetical protein